MTRYVVIRDLSACPVNADETLAWSDRMPASEYIESQAAILRANPDDHAAFARHAIAQGLGRLNGMPIDAGTCWLVYLETLRQHDYQLDRSRASAFVAAWIALRFVTVHSHRQIPRLLHRTQISDQVLVRLRTSVLDPERDWTGRLRQVVQSTVLALLEDPQTLGIIDKNSLFLASVLAIREHDTPGGEHIRRVMGSLVDAVWQELEPA